jgi:hypothetical protein
LLSQKTATKRELSKANKDLNAAKGTYPLDTGKIVLLTEKIEGLEKGLKVVEALEAELFPA